MAKIKLTKTELKQQRDALKQYTRFLPTLQLKKQQLQLEMRSCMERIAANEQKEQDAKRQLDSWIMLFGDAQSVSRISACLSVRTIRTGSQNIAGVNVPVYEGVDFDRKEYDLFASEPWIDDAIQAVAGIVEIQSERETIRRQYDLIARELRVTTQRVNLFEKVKIPEAKENIRRIQISISDEAIASVARSKIAKKKMQETAA